MRSKYLSFYFFFLLNIFLFNVGNSSEEIDQMRKKMKVLIPAKVIKQKIQKAAKLLDNEYQGEEVVILMVMKGSFCFVSDLIRAMHTPTTIQFISCSSYGLSGTKNTKLKIYSPQELNVKNKRVILIDDIFDSGITMTYLYQLIKNKKPKSLKTVVLMKKKRGNATTSIVPDLSLFNIEDRFVIGYGLDYKEYFRGLKDIYVIPEDL